MRSAALLVLISAVAVSGCGNPGRDLQRFTALTDAGDDASAEEHLRGALERHPDDVDLLLAAADFYLRADPAAEPYYKPRLSLHYAMRADKAAAYGDPRATEAMVRAHRGAGGFEETDELVREGLAGLNHPDADAPVALQPVDPDLVEPSVANVLEQRRRDALPPWSCGVGLVLVPAGSYPLDDGATAVIEEPFCVEETGRPVVVRCDTRELIDCLEEWAQVAAGPMSGLLRGAPDDHRCCDLATR